MIRDIGFIAERKTNLETGEITTHIRDYIKGIETITTIKKLPPNSSVQVNTSPNKVTIAVGNPSNINPLIVMYKPHILYLMQIYIYIKNI